MNNNNRVLLPMEEPIKKQINEIREELGLPKKALPISLDALLIELDKIQKKFLDSFK